MLLAGDRVKKTQVISLKKNMCVFFSRNRDFPTSRGILAMEDLPGVLIIGSFQSPFHGIQLLITRPRAEAEAINQDLEIFDMERYERWNDFQEVRESRFHFLTFEVNITSYIKCFHAEREREHVEIDFESNSF